MIKSISVAFIYLLTLPILPQFLSIVSSAVVIIYFLTMLKINAVNKFYNGSWRMFLKSWFKKRK
ncbi:MAG: hypothetical protein CMO82_11120 [Winogradskyella sp.]|mgnify:CR=1 FL=1|jgi:hypothetical protein|nr:hypothetical protein [Winogradskyella sp.]